MSVFDEDEAGVFYGPDFALRLMWQRAGVTMGQVSGILGLADEEALDGRAMAAQRVLCLPRCDIRPDDTLIADVDWPESGLSAGDRFVVLDAPQRLNDGLDMQLLLGSAAP